MKIEGLCLSRKQSMVIRFNSSPTQDPQGIRRINSLKWILIWRNFSKTNQLMKEEVRLGEKVNEFSLMGLLMCLKQAKPLEYIIDLVRLNRKHLVLGHIIQSAGLAKHPPPLLDSQQRKNLINLRREHPLLICTLLKESQPVWTKLLIPLPDKRENQQLFNPHKTKIYHLSFSKRKVGLWRSKQLDIHLLKMKLIKTMC